MKKIIFTVFLMFSFQCSVASATVIRHLHENFEVATFDGDLTFTDNYDLLVSASGQLSSPVATYYNVVLSTPYLWNGYTHDQLKFYSSTPHIVGPISSIGLAWAEDGNGNIDLKLGVGYENYASIGNRSYRLISYSFDAAPAPVPEPSTMLLFGTGVVSFVFWRRKKS